MTTVEEIVRAIDALPVADRLRVVERVVHELTSAVDEHDAESSDAGVEPAMLVERGGFLIVDAPGTAPLEMFDHRRIRAATSSSYHLPRNPDHPLPVTDGPCREIAAPPTDARWYRPRNRDSPPRMQGGPRRVDPEPTLGSRVDRS